MNWGPTGISSAMTTGASLSSINDVRQDDRVIGSSRAWSEVIRRATQVAAWEATTCIHGESGTGKEVIARFIHQRSPRRRGPFVGINCAALPEQLIESELFGFERGAFTGALQYKPGQIELAAGGVLFLDEVTDMPLGAQAKLLRVLQEREFLRLGGTRSVHANVRVIAASNRDLDEAVAHGHFRTDLYYRLNVFDIRIPPLRERRDDIIPLASSFLRDLAHPGDCVPVLTPDAITALLQHDWPGNVRELRNVIERATILCDAGLIKPRDLSLYAAPAEPCNSTELWLVERTTIQRVMNQVNGNKARASKQLGISRTQLYTRLRKYGLDGLEPRC
jgi:transcriptional regulator with PAS, ATPase and Fis domain